jgi:hypothetical protein
LSVPEAYIPQEYLPEALRGSCFMSLDPSEREGSRETPCLVADLRAKVSRQPSSEGDNSRPTSDNPSKKSTDEEE